MLLEQNLTVHVALLMSTSTLGLQRRC